MLSTHLSRYDSVEETAEKLKESIVASGWSCPGIRDLGKTIRTSGEDFSADVRLVELCKATHAAEVLRSNPEVSTLMPCCFGVYKGPNGKVYITGMNTGLMGKLFGGVIAEVMGNRVSSEEGEILSRVIHKG